MLQKADELYGSLIDNCHLETTPNVSASVEYFPNDIISSDNDLRMSSVPICVHLCENIIPNCSTV